MSIENFPGNSHRASRPSANDNQPSTDEEPKLEPVVTGRVIHRKKPLGRRVMDTLFRGDGGVVRHLMREVLVPALQTLVTDMVTQGIERAVYGEVRTPRRSGPIVRGSAVSRTQIDYNRPSTITRSPAPARRPLNQPSSSELGDVIVETDFEAQIIVERLYEAIQEYGAATVANLKELLKESPQYTDHKWGWEENDEFRIRRVRDGFRIDYPDPHVVR